MNADSGQDTYSHEIAEASPTMKKQQVQICDNISLQALVTEGSGTTDDVSVPFEELNISTESLPNMINPKEIVLDSLLTKSQLVNSITNEVLKTTDPLEHIFKTGKPLNKHRIIKDRSVFVDSHLFWNPHEQGKENFCAEGGTDSVLRKERKRWARPGTSATDFILEKVVEKSLNDVALAKEKGVLDNCADRKVSNHCFGLRMSDGIDSTRIEKSNLSDAKLCAQNSAGNDGLNASVSNVPPAQSPSSVSSVTSSRRLEWDSGADVGYAAQGLTLETRVGMSTVERMALTRGCTAILCSQLDLDGTPSSREPPGFLDTAKPIAHSTPVEQDKVQASSATETDSESEITPILRPPAVAPDEVLQCSKDLCCPEIDVTCSKVNQSVGRRVQHSNSWTNLPTSEGNIGAGNDTGSLPENRDKAVRHLLKDRHLVDTNKNNHQFASSSSVATVVYQQKLIPSSTVVRGGDVAPAPLDASFKCKCTCVVLTANRQAQKCQHEHQQEQQSGDGKGLSGGVEVCSLVKGDCGGDSSRSERQKQDDGGSQGSASTGTGSSVRLGSATLEAITNSFEYVAAGADPREQHRLAVDGKGRMLSGQRDLQPRDTSAPAIKPSPEGSEADRSSSLSVEQHISDASYQRKPSKHNGSRSHSALLQVCEKERARHLSWIQMEIDHLRNLKQLLTVPHHPETSSETVGTNRQMSAAPVCTLMKITHNTLLQHASRSGTFTTESSTSCLTDARECRVGVRQLSSRHPATARLDAGTQVELTAASTAVGSTGRSVSSLSSSGQVRVPSTSVTLKNGSRFRDLAAASGRERGSQRGGDESRDACTQAPSLQQFTGTAEKLSSAKTSRGTSMQTEALSDFTTAANSGRTSGAVSERIDYSASTDRTTHSGNKNKNSSSVDTEGLRHTRPFRNKSKKPMCCCECRRALRKLLYESDRVSERVYQKQSKVAAGGDAGKCDTRVMSVKDGVGERRDRVGGSARRCPCCFSIEDESEIDAGRIMFGKEVQESRDSQQKEAVGYMLVLEPSIDSLLQQQQQSASKSLPQVTVKVPVTTTTASAAHRPNRKPARDRAKENVCQRILTLQECLARNRPDFIAMAEERRRCLHELADLRIARHRSWHHALASGTSSNIPPLPLSTKRIFDQRSMRRQTERKYQKLSEVQSKKMDKKRKEDYRTNRLMAEIFTRKLQRKVLKGEVYLSNSRSVVSDV